MDDLTQLGQEYSPEENPTYHKNGYESTHVTTVSNQWQYDEVSSINPSSIHWNYDCWDCVQAQNQELSSLWHIFCLDAIFPNDT